MRKVFGIGETVLDIVIRNGNAARAVPGGSTFNSMISLGRCGVPSGFLSEVGSDRAGKLVLDFMTDNGVDPSHVNRLETKTPLSLAFLDENNDAQYTFYRDPVVARPGLRYPAIAPDDLVLFGSFYALNPAVRTQVKDFLDYARANGAILYYDVNFRPSHVKDLGRIGAALWENLDRADIVRGSHEDFQTLFGLDSMDAVFDGPLAGHCDRLIYTCGARPLQVRDRKGVSRTYPVTPIPTVSTIGAGDNFNAGFLFGLIRSGLRRADLVGGLTPEQWDFLVDCAQRFSADCCQSEENYVTPAFAERMKG